MRRARHGRRWEAASAYLDGELDAEARGAFERGLAEDGEARAHLEDIRFISESLAALPEAEPGRSFTLTERDIAADHGVMRREPAPMALRLSAIGAATGVAALAAVLAYDFLQTTEEGLLEPQAAPLMERAEVAGLVREEEEEAAMEAEESAEEAETASLASAEEEELEVDFAAAEEEEAEEESAEVDWRSREEVDAEEEAEAEAAPESEARFAAERGADEEVSEVAADADAAASAEREQETLASAGEDGAEEDAGEEPAVMAAEEEGEADAASASLEAESGEADDDGALLERGTEGVLLPEDAAETGEAGWETPVEVALALAAAALAAATVLLGRRWRRQQ